MDVVGGGQQVEEPHKPQPAKDGVSRAQMSATLDSVRYCVGVWVC